jgi:uncharacterized membrane protein HdeD (DUF308 family)
MSTFIYGNWWMVALRGVAALAFGLFAFLLPGVTLATLLLWFGAFAVVDGALDLLSAVRGRAGVHPPWWAALARGVIGIAVGVVTFLWPALTAISLLYLVAAWALLTGVLEIGAALHLRGAGWGAGSLGLAGALSIAFGLALAFAPGPGIFALLWLVGAYATVFGVLLLALAFQLRRARGPRATSSSASPWMRPAREGL